MCKAVVSSIRSDAHRQAWLIVCCGGGCCLFVLFVCLLSSGKHLRSTAIKLHCKCKGNNIFKQAPHSTKLTKHQITNGSDASDPGGKEFTPWFLNIIWSRQSEKPAFLSSPPAKASTAMNHHRDLERKAGNGKQEAGFWVPFNNGQYFCHCWLYSVELVPGYSTEAELDQTLSVTPLSQFFLPHFPALWSCFAPENVHPHLYLMPAVFWDHRVVSGFVLLQTTADHLNPNIHPFTHTVSGHTREQFQLFTWVPVAKLGFLSWSSSVFTY